MNKFAEHVTSTAFHLSLSRRMIEQLCQVEWVGQTWLSGGTGYSLIARGLVEQVMEVTDGRPAMPTAEQMKANPGIYCTPMVRLSEAGKLMMPLLKLAGLYVEKPQYNFEPAAELPPLKITLKKDFSGKKAGEEI